MSLTWEELLAIPEGTPLADLNVNILLSVNETYHKIAERTYIQAYRYKTWEDIERCYGFIWAASEDIAKSLITYSECTDDSVQVRPPDVLLPKRSISAYRDIVVHGKQSDPRRFRLVVSSHKTTVTLNDLELDPLRSERSRFTYYYKEVWPWEQQYPIAIEFDRGHSDMAEFVGEIKSESEGSPG